MIDTYSRHRPLALLAIVVVAQVMLLAFQVKGEHDVRMIRYWAVALVTPLERAGTWSFSKVGGAWGGYRAELLRFPDQHFSVACLCNVRNANPSRRANEVADVYLNGLMKPRDAKKELEENRKKDIHGAPLTADQLQAYAGDYWGEELGVTYRLGVTDGNLKVVAILDRAGLPRVNNFSPNELRSTGDDQFAIGAEAMIVKFKRDGKAAASEFQLDAGRTIGVMFTRMTAPER